MARPNPKPMASKFQSHSSDSQGRGQNLKKQTVIFQHNSLSTLQRKQAKPCLTAVFSPHSLQPFGKKSVMSSPRNTPLAQRPLSWSPTPQSQSFAPGSSGGWQLPIIHMPPQIPAELPRVQTSGCLLGAQSRCAFTHMHASSANQVHSAGRAKDLYIPQRSAQWKEM